MSIHLSIEAGAKTILSIPIATEPFFNRCWKPLAEKHKLKYISAIQQGTELDRDWVVALLLEIKQSSVYLSEEHFPANDMEFFKERLAFIITSLDGFLSRYPGALSGWVG